MIAKIKHETVMVGEIRSSHNMIGVIESSKKMEGSIHKGFTYKTYGGDYDVTPKIEEQELETANRVMEKNMKIKGIPYYETPNDYGETVYIGKEVMLENG